MKPVEIRCIYRNQKSRPKLNLRDDERIVSVDHRGSEWWIYIARDGAYKPDQRGRIR